MHKFFILFIIILLGGLGGFLTFSYYTLDDSVLRMLAAENGFIEQGTAIIFGLTGFFALVNFLQCRHKTWLYFSLLMALAALREMEAHRLWTTDSILKSNFYLDAEAWTIEHLAGLAVILLLLFLAYKMAKRVPRWISGVLHLRSEAWAIGLGLGLLTTAKVIDSMNRWLPILAEFKSNNRRFLDVAEESLEMTAAIFFLSICMMALGRKA